MDSINTSGKALLNIINDIRPDSFASGCILYYCIENDIDYNKTHISLDYHITIIFVTVLPKY